VTNKTTEKVTLLGKTILENRAEQSMLIVLEQGKAKIKGVISTIFISQGSAYRASLGGDVGEYALQRRHVLTFFCMMMYNF